MNTKPGLSAVVATAMLLVADAGRADVPGPPVNQSIGMRDVLIGVLTEDVCRGCHGPAGDPTSPDPTNRSVPDRHHLLYGQPIPAKVKVPYPDADGDGVKDTIYGCMNCHQWNATSGFTIQRDCLVCHRSSPHHMTDQAEARHCKACHGSVVDDYDDGHYIPAYQPSLVTPRRSYGDALPLNDRDNGAGACNYCHDEDDPNAPILRDSHDLHHGVKFNNFSSKCLWCHDTSTGPTNGVYTVRTASAAACENCHGPTSLHNIQADSPAVPTGTIVVGGELAGYGHVGRDNGAGDSDCWGCHGFRMAANAPSSGPLIPTLYIADRPVITAGTDAMVVLTGAAFINTVGGTLHEANVKLTAADGSSVTLTPDIVSDQGMLAVTIPGTTPPGNYGVNALKSSFTSNPVVISIVPKVKITRATATPKARSVTIAGSGFAGYARGSGTSVCGTTSTGRTVKGTIVSWTDKKIVAKFSLLPSRITVNSVFGKAASNVR